MTKSQRTFSALSTLIGFGCLGLVACAAGENHETYLEEDAGLASATGGNVLREAGRDGASSGREAGSGPQGGSSAGGGLTLEGGAAVGGRSGAGGSSGAGGPSGTGGSSGSGGTLARGGATGVGGALPGQDSSVPTGILSGPLFVGYFQSWSEHWAADGSATTLARLPAYVNVVNLSFMRPDTSYGGGSVSLGGTGLDFPYDGATLKGAIAALHANHPDTKVFLSVGGASYTNWSGFAADKVAAFVSDFGVDGVDIDYEPAVVDCTSMQGGVSCPSDAEFVNIVKSMRSALPRPHLLSVAAFSVGAYGEGAWESATPASSYAGISLGLFKDKDASSALDLVNVMSYDAGPTYDPIQALAAYRHYFSGRITMGVEVPPEGWGGHVYTIAEIDALAQAVSSQGAAGLMLWSIQKQGEAQSFATEMCLKLGLSDCSTPMP